MKLSWNTTQLHCKISPSLENEINVLSGINL